MPLNVRSPEQLPFLAPHFVNHVSANMSRWDHGYIEWYSNTYYKEDIGPLAVLVDLAADEEIQIAMQKIGPAYIPIAATLLKWAPTGDFPSGKMGSFDFLDGSLVYYAAKRRITLADSTQTDELVALIATGAAALALGSALVEAKLAASQADRARLTLGSEDLWQDFVTQKQQYNEDLARDTVIGFAIDRG